MATAQLELITARSDWKLDRHTIEVGRAGLAQARAALAQANPVLVFEPVVEEADPAMAPEPKTARPKRGVRVSAGQGTLLAA